MSFVDDGFFDDGFVEPPHLEPGGAGGPDVVRFAGEMITVLACEGAIAVVVGEAPPRDGSSGPPLEGEMTTVVNLEGEV